MVGEALRITHVHSAGLAVELSKVVYWYIDEAPLHSGVSTIAHQKGSGRCVGRPSSQGKLH